MMRNVFALYTIKFAKVCFISEHLPTMICFMIGFLKQECFL
jgi:hypothetical protein